MMSTFFLILFFIHEGMRTQRDLETQGHKHLEERNFILQMPCTFVMHLIYILCSGLVF